jgi:hypothetical protein
MIEAFAPNGCNECFRRRRFALGCLLWVHSIAITDEVTLGIPVGNSVNHVEQSISLWGVR